MSLHVILASARSVLAPAIVALMLVGHPAPAEASEDSVPTQNPTVTLWDGLNRAYIKVRPFVGLGFAGRQAPPLLGGVISELGVEANTRSGFQIGVQLAPLTFKSFVQRPDMTARLQLGYTSSSLAIGMGVGSTLSWLYPQLGPVVRIGAFDGTYALVRVSWAVSPPAPLPVDFDLDLNIPVARRVRLNLDIGGGQNDVAGLTGAFVTFGIQYLVSPNRGRGTTALTAGAGVAWLSYALGPVASLGLEKRF